MKRGPRIAGRYRAWLSARAFPGGGAGLHRTGCAVGLGLPGWLAGGLLALDREQHFPLPFDPLASFFWLRRALFGLGRRLALALHAAAQRIHEIDHLRWLAFLGVLDLRSGLLALQQFLQRVLVLIAELGRIEVAGLGLDDVGGELEHVFRDLLVLDVVEEVGLLAHLVGVAQRYAVEALVAGFEGDDVLARSEGDLA